MVWLGIDGGGTKTACALFGDDGRELDRLVLPTCHYAQAGFQGMGAVLAQAVSWARTQAETSGAALAGIGFGICGYGEDAEASARIDETARAVAGTTPHLVVNDVDAAWAAGLSCADGIALIAGTGSIALGVCGSRRMRCGGWDYELGDEGSAGWLGKELLYAFTRESDGRATRGPLYTLVREHLALANDFDIIAFAHRHLGERGRIAALAPLVTQAARAGDAAAREILERAAQEEALLVRTIHAHVFDAAPHDGSGPAAPIPVTYIGGTFRAGSLLLDPLRAALPSGCTLVEPAHDPAFGPVLLLRRRAAACGSGSLTRDSAGAGRESRRA